MLVTRLEGITNKRTKVYLDEEYAFVLYPQDIKRYHVQVDVELSENVLASIYREVILRRAKQKAMQLLMRRNYSEYDMRQRLRKDLYPERAIDETISFLYSYHYLDDARFTEYYIMSKSSTMGFAAIRQKLREHGIDDSLTQTIYNNLQLDDHDVLALQMRKKLSDKKLDDTTKRRVISYFLRHGFSYRQIIDCMRQIAGNEAAVAYDFDNVE